MSPCGVLGGVSEKNFVFFNSRIRCSIGRRKARVFPLPVNSRTISETERNDKRGSGTCFSCTDHIVATEDFRDCFLLTEREIIYAIETEINKLTWTFVG